MNKYSVSIIFDASKCVEVNAESPEGALGLAYDEAGYVSLCHQCSGEVEIGDAVKAIVYDESGGEVADDGYQSMEIAKITQQRDELLAALEGAVGLLSHYGRTYGHSMSDCSEFKSAEEAIAKAKGGAA